MKKSVIIAGHSTSVSLEVEFWNVLEHIAEENTLSLTALIRQVDGHMDCSKPRNLASNLRVYALKYLINSQDKQNISD
jgi:predicted DNA-binding ribbon-helix-helix protein